MRRTKLLLQVLGGIPFLALMIALWIPGLIAGFIYTAVASGFYKAQDLMDAWFGQPPSDTKPKP